MMGPNISHGLAGNQFQVGQLVVLVELVPLVTGGQGLGQELDDGVGVISRTGQVTSVQVSKDNW